jgi:hypothetical protein
LQKAATSLQGLQQRSGKGVTMVLGGVLPGCICEGKHQRLQRVRQAIFQAKGQAKSIAKCERILRLKMLSDRKAKMQREKGRRLAT